MSKRSRSSKPGNGKAAKVPSKSRPHRRLRCRQCETLLDEYLTGSSPVTAASNFHAPQLSEVPGLNVLNLTWHGGPARNYTVQTSPDLTTWTTLSTLPGLTGPTSLVVEAPVRPVRNYYKVVVVP